MASPHSAIERWFAVQRGQEQRFLSCNNILSERRVLYSYGSHFPLVRRINDKDGNRELWLVNGDSFSNTTNRHQATVRSFLRGDRAVTIPDSVLDAAQIARDSIKLLESTSDRMVDTVHSSATPPGRMEWSSTDVIEFIPWTPQERLAFAEDVYCTRVQELVNMIQKDGYDFMRSALQDILRQTPEQYAQRQQHVSWYYQGRHVTLRKTTPRPHVGNRTVDIVDTEHGPRYVWTTTRHWLGESLIEARVPAGMRRLKCKDCSGTGWDSVQVATEYRWRGPVHLGACSSCNQGVQHKRMWRTTKFLSGFDHNEARESYFFCELPKCDATTVDEAYEALKPEAVRIAERVGRDVARQGDIFGIAMPSITRTSLRQQGAVFAKRGNLLNTNHEATETATLPDGTLYARGTLYHAPDGRDPDHARCKLPGTGWSVIVKNTVPITA